MKTYIIKVKDNSVDEIVENAKRILSQHPNLYAVIYGYQDQKGNDIYLDDPIPMKSKEGVDAYINTLANGKKKNDKVIYALYRNQLDDDFNDSRYAELFDSFAAMINAFDKEHHEELEELVKHIEYLDLAGPDVGSKFALSYMETLK